GPRVVVVADLAGDRLPADTAAQVAARWAQSAPHVRVDGFSSHDGGAGFAAVVAERLGATLHPVVVPGPTGADVPAALAVVDADGGGTAYLDTAQVAGRHLVDADRLRDPEGMTSAGVGRLLALARGAGVRRIVV